MKEAGDCNSPGIFGPVVTSSKTWNAATGDKSPELERQAEACFLEQPTTAAAFCKFVLIQDNVVVFLHLGQRSVVERSKRWSRE